MQHATPNLITLLIDDLGYTDLGCYGSSFYETPNLDRLAAQGLRFTDAYASCPVCSPTRASLMSGKSPARVGITQFIGGHAVGRLCDVPYFHALPQSEIALPKALKAADYQTWHVGKWHLGEGGCSPEKHGFDVNVGGCGWGMPKHGFFAPWKMPNLEEGAEGDYLTDRLTDEAITLIEQRDPERPFYLNLCHYAVHTPIQAPEHLVEKYRAKAARLGLDQRDPFVTGGPHPCDHKKHLPIKYRQFQSDPTYAAMVENLDSNIGRLLEALERSGCAEDTLVVFTSDNGGLATSEGSPTCNRPLATGKGWMYEGGNRVCQIARWPGVIAAGRETDAPTDTCDWYPTFLELAGLPPNPVQHADGTSLAPLLRGEAWSRGPLFWHYPHYSNQGDAPACAIRDGDWKLIEHFEDGRLELFNLRDDLSEEHDRSADEPERLRDLHGKLVAWRDEIGALIPKPNPNWVAPEPIPGDSAEV